MTQGFGDSRTPTLSEVIRMAIASELADVHTCLPGRIEKYDSTLQKADVKPLLKRPVILDTDEGEPSDELETLPVISDVPVRFPRGGGFFCTMPLAKGDFVLLVFCERSIDNYMDGAGTDTDPVDLRQFDLADAVAITGFSPYSRSIKGALNLESNAIFGKENGGIQIHLTSSNTLEIRLNGTAPMHVAIYEMLETFWTSFKIWLDAHTHSTGVGPSGPPATQSPSWDTGIKSTKVAIPSG